MLAEMNRARASDSCPEPVTDRVSTGQLEIGAPSTRTLLLERLTKTGQLFAFRAGVPESNLCPLAPGGATLAIIRHNGFAARVREQLSESGHLPQDRGIWILNSEGTHLLNAQASFLIVKSNSWLPTSTAARSLGERPGKQKRLGQLHRCGVHSGARRGERGQEAEKNKKT